MSSTEVAINASFDDIPNSILRLEVDELRTKLNNLTQQMALERESAAQIHTARMFAIDASPALKRIFTANLKPEEIDTTQLLSAAFGREVSIGVLPSGMVKGLQKSLRAAVHPDHGGDAEAASSVGSALDDIDEDEVFAATRAMLVAEPKEDEQSLRDERYRLTLALDSSETVFSDEDEVLQYTQSEIEATEWKIRVSAALKTVGLVLGENDDLMRFMHSIVRSQSIELINLMNSYLPEILSIQERIAKGNPKVLTEAEIEFIDQIFERTWSTLHKPDDALVPYSPPYQHWLPIILPALRALDPGRKDGELYTFFEKPIKVISSPPVQARSPQQGSLFDEKKSIYSEQTLNNNSNKEFYNKY